MTTAEETSGVAAELRTAARTFVGAEAPVGRMRKVRDSELGFDPDLWRKVAGMGWLGLLVPEAHGGLGLGMAEQVALVEELGAALCPEPVAPVGFAARLIALGGQAEPCATLLPRIASGELRPAVAWQEAVGVVDPAAVGANADARDGALEITGVKQFVVHGLGADGYVVSAREGQAAGLYWVPAGSAGLSYEPARRADGSEHGTLRLERVRVEPSCVVAQAGSGLESLRRAVDEATVAAAAELIGVARRGLGVTLEYLRTRKQFGQPIGSFQGLQHRCVDLFIQTELARSSLGVAIRALESDDAAGRAMAASRVKARASDIALNVGRESIQMHGAIGYTDECDAGLFLKRALVLSAWLGNAAQHRRRHAVLATPGGH